MDGPDIVGAVPRSARVALELRDFIRLAVGHLVRVGELILRGPISAAYLNWGLVKRVVSGWVAFAVLVRSVDARAYLGPRPGGR
jgi:hypothetical protein